MTRLSSTKCDGPTCAKIRSDSIHADTWLHIEFYKDFYEFSHVRTRYLDFCGYPCMASYANNEVSKAIPGGYNEVPE